MSDEQKITVFMFVAALIGVGFFCIELYKAIDSAPTKIKVVYDCRIAEISPDYPQSIKEKCRKLLMPTTRIAA